MEGNVMKAGGIKEWFDIDGDNTLRLDYPLNENSIVVDLGAYIGEWSEKIYSRSGCRIIAYEPVREYYEKAKERLRDNDRIQIINAAVGAIQGTTEISLLDDGSSFYRPGAIKEIVRVHSINSLLSDRVDLMKMNIEGGEYEVLYEIIKQGKTTLVSNYQIQFHRCVPNYEEKYGNIIHHFAKTHELTYLFPFVWENWRLR